MSKNKFTIRELKSNSFDWDKIPNSKGVYFVKIKDTKKPIFLSKGTGGWFRKKNPNVSIEMLDKNWVNLCDDREKIIYIGQAGGGKSKSNLRRRIRQYIRFGQGEPVGHWGGRYIWQLCKMDDSYIYWKKCNNPRDEERKLLCEFKNKHSSLPFANLRM